MIHQIKWLLTILAALLIIVLVLWLINRLPKNTRDVPLFQEKVEDVASFELNNFTLGLLFKKDKEQWLVKKQKNILVKELEEKAQAPLEGNESNFVEAKTDDVNEILSDLFSLKNLEVVATEKTEQNVFEINNYSLHLIFYDANGAELDRIYFGKPGPQMGSVFIKKGNEDTIYLLDHNLSISLLRQYNEWLLSPPQEEKEKLHGKKKK